MTRAWCVALAVGMGFLLSFSANLACAQRVALLRPGASDDPLLSAFAHLRGELTVHDFTVVVVEGEPGGADRRLERAAEQAQAAVSVELVRAGDLVTAEVYISDPRSGKTLRRTVTTVPRAEGPSVLAVRVVDLVRASLRELAALSVAPSPPLTSSPPEAGESTPRTSSVWRSRRFALEAAGVMQGSPASFSPAYGASLALGYDALRWLALRVVLQAPLRRARHASGAASATLTQEQLMAELRVRVYEHGTLSLSLLGDAGAHHVSVEGKASLPYRSSRDATWTALFAAGLGGEWRLVPALALSLRARCLMLAPRPVIHVADDRVTLGRPSFQLAGGIDVAF